MMNNIFINYSLFILFLPLAAFLIQIFYGRRLPRQGDWVSVSAVGITLILSIAMFVAMLLDNDPESYYRIHQAIWATSIAIGNEGDWVELGTGRGFTMSAVLKFHKETLTYYWY